MDDLTPLVLVNGTWTGFWGNIPEEAQQALNLHPTSELTILANWYHEGLLEGLYLSDFYLGSYDGLRCLVHEVEPDKGTAQLAIGDKFLEEQPRQQIYEQAYQAGLGALVASWLLVR